MVRVTLILLLTGHLIGYSNENNKERLDAFVSKVEIFYKGKANWTMPNTNPKYNLDNMDTYGRIISSVDHASGLSYMVRTGKLVDLELGIALDTATGIIYDYKEKKEYKLFDLLKERKKS